MIELHLNKNSIVPFKFRLEPKIWDHIRTEIALNSNLKVISNSMTIFQIVDVPSDRVCILISILVTQ